MITSDLKFNLVGMPAGQRRKRGEAERELRIRNELLAFVAHELKTPLNAITGWA